LEIARDLDVSKNEVVVIARRKNTILHDSFTKLFLTCALWNHKFSHAYCRILTLTNHGKNSENEAKLSFLQTHYIIYCHEHKTYIQKMRSDYKKVIMVVGICFQNILGFTKELLHFGRHEICRLLCHLLNI